MSYEFELANDTGVLKLAGELSIGRAAELKASLLASMARADRVTLRLDAVTGIDLSGLQVLCSAHRSFQMKNKELSICGTGREMLRQAALRAGFPEANHCVFASGRKCLWAEGDI